MISTRTASRGKRLCRVEFRGGADARQLAAWIAALVIVLCSGCASGSFGRKLPIDGLHLLGTPVAMNMDDKPGADGMGVRVYALNRAENETVQIREGSIELLLFDGNVRPEEVGSAKPLRVWRYSAKQLRQHEQRTSIGISYAFVPVWSDTPPEYNRVSIVARYTNAPATLLDSAPVSVPLAGR